MTGAKDDFTMLDDTFKLEVRLGDKKKLAVKGKGTLKINTSDGEFKLLDEVYYAPKLEYNLLSVGQLMKKGYGLHFEDGYCTVIHKASRKEIMNISVATNNMFVFDPSKDVMCDNKQSDESLLWHCRYGHLYFDGLKKLYDGDMVRGLPKVQMSTCEGCIMGKHARQPFQSSSWRASHKLELIHTDLCGPMQSPSFGKSLYYLLFIDDLTRMCWVYFITNKSSAFEKFKLFKTMVEKESECSIKVLRSNRGEEFCSRAFESVCEQNGIKREKTPPYTPHHNGVVERKNRTIIGLACGMLKERGLPNMFWAEAVSTTVHVINRAPTKAVPTKTPFEAWYDHKPNVSDLRIIGCVVYGHVPQQRRRKLDNKAERERRRSWLSSI